MSKTLIKESVENIDFIIIDKNNNTREQVFNLLHQYPGNFVPGLFEKHAEQDFIDSDVMVAYDKERPVGCLMLNRKNNEFLWLAVEKDTEYKRSEIAKKLFYTLALTADIGTEFLFNIPTEDSQIKDHPYFSGMNFEQARKMYREMGLEMNKQNRIEDYYGEGAHVYQVRWKL